jgi:hypothetical protein
MGKNPASFKEKGADRPVERVSWNEAQEFLKKLNRMEENDNTVSPPRPSGNTPAGRGAPQVFAPATMNRILKNTPGMSLIPDIKHMPLVKESLMPGAYMTCTATSGNGAKIGIEDTPPGLLQTPKVLLPVKIECCAAARGSTMPSSHALLIASTATQTAAAIISAFELLKLIVPPNAFNP